ncbi:hypothetical protein BUY35_00470 [Staphylococcus cohnii]|nr:hypothetical protein BUY35_00470 [Staphylococcus cohnii]
MFDTLNDVLTNILEPISETGRNVILVVAVVLLVGAICSALFCLIKQKWVGLIISICIAIGLGVLGNQGYNVMQTLGEKQGDDFEGQINAVFALGLIPTYVMHRKYKKKAQKTEL